jgi:hypothetical protein
MEALAKYAQKPGQGLLIRNKNSKATYEVLSFDVGTRLCGLRSSTSKTTLKVKLSEREDPLYEPLWR